MARINIDLEDFQPGDKLIIALVNDDLGYEPEDPDPGEEIPEEPHSPHLMAVGGVHGSR